MLCHPATFVCSPTCRGGERRALLRLFRLQALKSQQLHAFAKLVLHARTPGPSSIFKRGPGAGGSCRSPVPKESTRPLPEGNWFQKVADSLSFSSLLSDSLNTRFLNQIRLFGQANCFSIPSWQPADPLESIAHAALQSTGKPMPQCAALACHPTIRRLVHLLRPAPGPKTCKIARLVVGNEKLPHRRCARRHLCGCIGFPRH